MDDPDDGLLHPELRPLRAEPARVDGGDGIALIDPLGIAEPTFVPAPVLAIARWFDGTADAAAIARKAAAAATGARIDADLVRDVARQFDARLLLETATFRAARRAAAAAFVRAGARPGRHAGSAGYPAEPGELRRALAAMVGDRAAAAPLAGLVAPHIDLERGHRGYAEAYGRLLAAPPADLYVVFGTGHQGPLAPVTGLLLDWETPLGTARTDRAFVAAVHDAIGPPQEHDLLLHRDEHSIEFQVLLLQHLHERRAARGERAPFEVAGFLCGRLPSRNGDPLREPWCKDLLAAFRAAAARSGKRVCWLAGADLAHVGPFFGDERPVDSALLQRLDRDERARLRHLEEGRPGAFHAAVAAGDNQDRVCSAPAIALTAALAGGNGELLHYGNAPADDGSQVVGFCAMAFGGR
jgi:AmmeMemoRadiSam system protein B